MSQTSYSANFPRSRVGMIADGAPSTVRSALAHEAVRAGKVVVRHAAETGLACATVKPTSAASAAADFVGIVCYDAAKQPASTVSPGNEFAAQDSVSILTSGRVWVVTEDSTSAGDDVFVRCTVTGSQEFGSFRNDADSASCLQVAGAKFIRASGAGELNIVEIRSFAGAL